MLGHLQHLASQAHHVARGSTVSHHRLRRRLLTAFSATLVVDLLGTTVIYALERNEPGSDVHTFFESFFWVTTQLLTISSQMANPVTTGGRIADMLIELWAITVVAATAGAFAAFLHERGRAEDA